MLVDDLELPTQYSAKVNVAGVGLYGLGEDYVRAILIMLIFYLKSMQNCKIKSRN